EAAIGAGFGGGGSSHNADFPGRGREGRMHSQRAFANFASFGEHAAIRSEKTSDAATQESGIMILRRNARQACSSAHVVCKTRLQRGGEPSCRVQAPSSRGNARVTSCPCSAAIRCFAIFRPA